MLRLGIRIQNAILATFTPRGTRPTPIWDLVELIPDAAQRATIQELIRQSGVHEHDFLRWRNACTAVDMRKSIEALQVPSPSGFFPTPTPLWVTSHLIRRKVFGFTQASIGTHIAVTAVPGSGPLAPEHEPPLVAALSQAVRFNISHPLPAIVSRLLALRKKGHIELIKTLCRPPLTSSPLIATSLQLVLDDIKIRRIILPRQVWDLVWKKWCVKDTLGTEFTAIVRRRMSEQGIQLSPLQMLGSRKPHSHGATYYWSHIKLTPKRGRHSNLAVLKAAARSESVSASLLVAIASPSRKGVLPHRLSPMSRIKWKPHRAPIPPAPFFSILVQGLVRKKAYSRALKVWDHARNRGIRLTGPLVEAVISAHLARDDPTTALRVLDEYALPIRLISPRRGSFHFVPSSSILTSLLSQVSPSAQPTLFTIAHHRWSIRPNSEALEVVMVEAMRTVQELSHSADRLNLRRNIRRFGERFQSFFTRASEPISARPDPLYDMIRSSQQPITKAQSRVIRQNAIELFEQVVLGNWPFIRGEDQGYGHGLLNKSAVELFIPKKLRIQDTESTAPEPDSPVQQSIEHEVSSNTPAFEFNPSPLHPSPSPRFPNACPTRRAWTGYLALLEPIDLPEALRWMRSVDDFLHAQSAQRFYPQGSLRPVTLEELGDSSPLNLFRPEREALTNSLVRWEEAILAGETLLGRAWDERQGRAGKEGALRDWLVDWLGSGQVPSHQEVAAARMEMGAV